MPPLPVTEGNLDVKNLLPSSTFFFPENDLRQTTDWSHKQAGRGPTKKVPHEYCYQSQLASIIRLWLPLEWQFFPEVKTGGDKRRIDFVIESSADRAGPSEKRFVLELLAISSNPQLEEHYSRAAEYGMLVRADHVWVIHFCGVELDADELPVPRATSNVRVLHLVHTTEGDDIIWSALYCEPGTSQTLEVGISDPRAGVRLSTFTPGPYRLAPDRRLTLANLSFQVVSYLKALLLVPV